MALAEHFILGFVSLLSLVVGWQTARLRPCATKQKVKVMFLLNRLVNLQITQFFGDSVAFILQNVLENLFIFPPNNRLCCTHGVSYDMLERIVISEICLIVCFAPFMKHGKFAFGDEHEDAIDVMFFSLSLFSDL